MSRAPGVSGSFFLELSAPPSSASSASSLKRSKFSSPKPTSGFSVTIIGGSAIGVLSILNSCVPSGRALTTVPLRHTTPSGASVFSMGKSMRSGTPSGAGAEAPQPMPTKPKHDESVLARRFENATEENFGVKHAERRVVV
eukprot:5926554-Prymnesium_polylepis.1